MARKRFFKKKKNVKKENSKSRTSENVSKNEKIVEETSSIKMEQEMEKQLPSTDEIIEKIGIIMQKKIEESRKKENHLVQNVTNQNLKEPIFKSPGSSIKNDYLTEEVSNHMIENIEKVEKSFQIRLKNISINVEKLNQSMIFEKKFRIFLQSCNTSFRYSLGLLKCQSFDSEEIYEVFNEISNKIEMNSWPFKNPSLTLTANEAREILSRLSYEIKIVLTCICFKHGFLYKFVNQKTISIPQFMLKIDLDYEMNIFKAIIKELKSIFIANGIQNDEIPLIKELDSIFDDVLPALKKSDSDELYKYGISDCLSTIADRKRLGFEINQEDVDEMLDSSLNQRGFGEFTSTALECVELFSTRNQLEKIVKNIGKMFSSVDIRIREGGIKAITNIFRNLDENEKEIFFDQLDTFELIPINKLFTSEDFEACLNSRNSRYDYFKYFYSALGVDTETNKEISSEDLSAVFMYFFTVYKTEDVNYLIFKFLSSNLFKNRKKNIGKPEEVEFENKENDEKLKDKKAFIKALHLLPKSLRKRIKIGNEFMNDEIGEENIESLYWQINNMVRTASSDKECKYRIENFLLAADLNNQLLSINKVIDILMKFIENGERQKFAAQCLNMLQNTQIQRLPITIESIHKLILLALSKYSLPSEKEQKTKFDFIEAIFVSCGKICTLKQIEIDQKYISDEWKKLDHPWFSVVYLSNFFNVLNFAIEVDLPWNQKDENSDNQDSIQEKYKQIVQLSTAWPNCVDIEFLNYVIKNVLPDSVDSFQLIKEMETKIDDLSVTNERKEMLKKSYKNYIETIETLEKNPVTLLDVEVAGNEVQIEERPNNDETNDAISKYEKKENETEEKKTEILSNENQDDQVKTKSVVVPSFMIHLPNDKYDSLSEKEKTERKTKRMEYLSKYGPVTINEPKEDVKL